jgi:hypothetical protein
MKVYPPTDALRRAVVIRDRVQKLDEERESLTQELDTILGPGAASTRAKMSPETRAKIAATQKANWAQRGKVGKARRKPVTA